MNLNIAKTKVIHFRKKVRSKRRSEHCFLFNNEEIECAEQYKYLGLLLANRASRVGKSYRGNP